MSEWWEYDNLESGAPYDWAEASRGNHPDDNIDFHIDLGAGKLPKGRLTIDLRGEADIRMDLNSGVLIYAKGPVHEKYLGGLPFPNDSIHSIVSHHCLEHIGNGFIRLMDECYRVLVPGGKFRIVVPLFPSFTAVTDPDHVRYFTPETFNSFVHEAGPDVPFWSESFSTPYTQCRFKMTHMDYTPAKTLDQIAEQKYNGSGVFGDITIDDLFAEPREIRVTLQKP